MTTQAERIAALPKEEAAAAERRLKNTATLLESRRDYKVGAVSEAPGGGEKLDADRTKGRALSRCAKETSGGKRGSSPEHGETRPPPRRPPLRPLSQALFTEYHKGELSVEEAARKVGLALPKVRRRRHAHAAPPSSAPSPPPPAQGPQTRGLSYSIIHPRKARDVIKCSKRQTTRAAA